MWANADLITAGKYKTLCVAARLNSQKKMQKALKSNDDNISSLLDSQPTKVKVIFYMVLNLFCLFFVFLIKIHKNTKLRFSTF